MLLTTTTWICNFGLSICIHNLNVWYAQLDSLNRFSQIVATSLLLLIIGASGTNCLVPNAQMSDAEKSCCRQMAGQCDTDMAAKHPCCRKTVGHHNAALLKNFASVVTLPLSLPVARLGSDISSEPLIASFEPFTYPSHDPPIPSVQVLRI